MRIEYIVVSMILLLVVFLVIITLLSGVAPNINFLFDLFRSKG